MAAPPSPTPVRPDYRQHLEVETPENVVLDLEIAGAGSRLLAAIIDWAIISLSFVALALLLMILSAAGIGLGRASVVVMILAAFFGFYGYFIFFEGLRQGQTPGKRRMGIRVISDTGHGITFGSAALRGLLRTADFLPPPWLTGLLLVAFHPRAKRLGDIVAGTIVVRDRPAQLAVTRVATPEPVPLSIPELTDEEFQLLTRYRERAGSLDAAARRRIEAALVARFGNRIPVGAPTETAALELLQEQEAARRRSMPGGPGVGGVAQRFIERKSPRWDEFDVLAQRVHQRGLDHLGPDELLDFAARYREIAADLARARTYRVPATTLVRLERLAAAGHNALYREERGAIRRLWDTLSRDCPAAVVQARGYVLLAFLLFAVPAVAGYTLLRQRPALAGEILPDVMLQRAAAGQTRIAEGHKYITVPPAERATMASFIITNNIRVAFICFAGGIFAGVGSLVMLAFNGFQIGTSAGHFANVGLLGYLLQFIAGHGVLELFSIWVAGAAGFMLGRSVIAPGDLTRGDALVVAGRQAIHMIGAVVVLLGIAGLIEGLISAGDQGWTVRLGISAVSLLFLALYLLNGARWLRERAPVMPREASNASGSPALRFRADW